MIKNFSKKYIRFLLILIFSEINADNLGVWGVVYPINEQDFSEFIYEKLKIIQETGELDRINEKIKSVVQEKVQRPKPVAWLTVTEKSKVKYKDLTFEVKENIYNVDGQIMHAKGSRINPLETVALTKELFFFDGDDNRQIELAKEQLVNKVNSKIILTNGDVKKTSELLNCKVYFDQYGILSRKLELEHIPVRVSQEGLFLKIEEIGLKE